MAKIPPPPPSTTGLFWPDPKKPEGASDTREKIQALIAANQRTLHVRRLSEVPLRAVDWLWSGWIPRGYLTVLAGETGAGKSTVLADVAARVSTGRNWPGEEGSAISRPPASVLWLGSEDGLEDMLLPRLTAANADLNMVGVLEVSTRRGRETFSLQDDLEIVRAELLRARNSGAEVAMLVIDPVMSYLLGSKNRRVDSNDAGQLRQVLEPWMAFAQEFNLAIICVTHFAKDTARSALHRVLGSGAFTATARSVCVVASADPEGDPFEKVLLQVKTNLPEQPQGAWRFHTERVLVGQDNRQKPVHATRAIWEFLDPEVRPATVFGRSNGPQSTQASGFGIWLQANFKAAPGTEWMPVTPLRAAALRENIVSAKWWDDHSGEFLEKANFGGQFHCRRKWRSTEGG